jgi:hypothetical protein
MASIRVNTELADEAMQLMGAKSRTEAIRTALENVVAALRFKQAMTKRAAKANSSPTVTTEIGRNPAKTTGRSNRFDRP